MDSMDAIKMTRAYTMRLVESKLIEAMIALGNFSSNYALSDEEKELQLECEVTILGLDSLYQKFDNLAMEYYSAKEEKIEI